MCTHYFHYPTDLITPIFNNPTTPLHPRYTLSMHKLLHMWINAHHPIIQIRVLILQHSRVKRHRDKQGGNTALDRHHEDVTDLQADEERVCHDDGVVIGIDDHIAVAQVQV